MASFWLAYYCLIKNGVIKNMLNLNIVCVGKIKEKYLKDAIGEYSKRISKFCNINIVEVDDEKLPSKIYPTTIEEIKNKECKKITNALKKDSYIIALDLSGKQLTSEEFAGKISDISVNGNSTISFIIGGTLGLTNEILDLADFKLSFSKMTFPHQLIRVFMLEQIFRGFKILNNETYHW